MIFAQRLTTNPANQRGLAPLIDQAKSNLGKTLREVSADSGFANEANLQALAERGINAYLAPAPLRRSKDGGDGQRDFKHKPLMTAMANKLKRAGRRSLSTAQADRRPGVRTDQTAQRLPPVPP